MFDVLSIINAAIAMYVPQYMSKCLLLKFKFLYVFINVKTPINKNSKNPKIFLFVSILSNIKFEFSS